MYCSPMRRVDTFFPWEKLFFGAWPIMFLLWRILELNDLGFVLVLELLKLALYVVILNLNFGYFLEGFWEKSTFFCGVCRDSVKYSRNL